MKKFEFEIEKQDCSEYSKECWNTNNISIFWAGTVFMSLIILIVSFSLSLLLGPQGILYVLFILIPTVITTYRKVCDGEILYNSYKVKEITYEFSEVGIRIIRSESDTFYPWNSIIKIYQTKNLIIIFMRPYKGFRFDATGMFIPKRFFASEEECVKFVEEISSNIRGKI